MLGDAYYFATCKMRQWYFRRLATAGRGPIAVLTFHRVADDGANPWTTPTRCFRQTVKWLRSEFDLISLEEVQQRIRSGTHRRAAVSITFDDGYADNCQAALPLLLENGIPFTYFVTADAVLEGKPFLHDTRMGNRLATNTTEQVRELARLGVEIGAHTRTHADLGRVSDPEILADEIVSARDDLEQAIGTRIRYFAFPFGRPEHLTVAAVDLARTAGYEAVCSAYGGWNYPGQDAFCIQRRVVDGPPSRAKNWSLVDPMRELLLPRFRVPPAIPKSIPLGAEMNGSHVYR